MKPAEGSSEQTGGTTVEELERFRQDIERYRARRKAVSEEFDGFIQSFRQEPAPPPVIRTPPPPAVGIVTPPVAAVPSSEARVTAAAPPAAPKAIAAIPPPAPAPAPAATRRTGRRTSAVIPIGVLAALVVVLAVWLWRGERQTAGGPTPRAAGTAQGAAPAPAPAAAAPTPATPPPAAAPDRSESELRTSRAVWVRVVADGARVINRELPADSRVPFRAENTIEIRTGDAGAVRLVIGGRDQGLLGRDGGVVTRSFTVPPR